MFQFRLAADSLRDLLLSPISVIAALLGLLRPDNPGWALDRLMQFGRRTDDWINLFEHNEHARQEECTQTLDDFIDQVETEVKRRMDPDTPADEATWASSVSAFVGRKPASS
ncbi:hypothetical protein [uncultured Cohaesibacter sp.]|uniref:hypothetical protein n=1 Tax=uncultured Cohaesibacter sp. TaxID=1002546 RepID=UPI0029C8B711|nr:hypothetical protein [uncultured Cohaesibacter sp.]